MKMKLTAILSMVLFSCNRSYFADELNISSTFLGDNLQLVEVKTGHVPDTKGKMILYERKRINDKFYVVDSFDVTVGRSGFAWDAKSPFKAGFQRIKQEGDGCSPAGIFTFGPVFSYHDINCAMPFQRVDETDLCVDDVNSVYYNTLIDSSKIANRDYNSFEKMKRLDDLYEYGIWINYNSSPTVKGNGSCIFVHVWENENTPTSGCTALSRENILKLIHWLDPAKNPVLIQYAEMGGSLQPDK